MSRKTPLQTQELFLGARLGAAREKAGISLEQAARDTRIRVQRLREIETDDFSGFVHPTYARLFLIDYAAYLGVPRADIAPFLPETAPNAAGGLDYLDALSGDSALSASHRATLRARRRMLVTILAIVAGLALVICGIAVWWTWKKLERIAPRGGVPSESVVPAVTPLADPLLTPAPPDASPATEPAPEGTTPETSNVTP